MFVLINSNTIPMKITVARSHEHDNFNLWHDMEMDESSDDNHDGNDTSTSFSNSLYWSPDDANSCDNLVSQFMEAMPSRKDESSENFREMFLPGTVIHIVPEKKDIPVYKRWGTPDAQTRYEAYVANREAFMDIIVSPSMFIDHLPWRYIFFLNTFSAF